MKARRFLARMAAAGAGGGLLIASVGAADAAPGPGRPAAQAAATPVFIAGTYHGRRPREIGISADGGNIVTGLHWSRWGATRATGTGTSNIQGCVPNCAAGTETPVVTRITLRDPRHGYFTKMTERRDGHTQTFTYTPGHQPDLWPGYAS